METSPTKHTAGTAPEPILALPQGNRTGKGSVLYVPSCLTNLRTSFEAPRDQGMAQRRPRSTPRKARGPSDDLGNDLCHPHSNYMLKGGTRVAEQKLHSMNRAAVKDLRTTNDMLASELMRMRSVYEQESSMLRQANIQLEGDKRMMEEKLRQAADKAASEAAARTAQDVQHMGRLREITKRLRDEHNQRTAAQAELNQHKLAIATLGAQAGDVGQLRGEVARLEAGAAGAAATVTDLRARLAAAEDKLETDAGVRHALQSRLHAAEASNASVTERAANLAGSVAELEGQLAAVRHALEEARQELACCKTSMQQEREAHAALRQSAGTVQAHLTELQASSTLAAAQAAAEKSELERVRRELCELRLGHEAAQAELASLREQAIHTKGELAGYKASAAELGAECTTLRSDLLQARSDLASMRESHAAQLAELSTSRANEVAALSASHDRALAAVRGAAAEEVSGLREHCGAELESLRRTSEAEIAELKKQVSTYKYRAENHEQVFLDNESLTVRLQRAESSLHQKESVLSEALTSHAAQLELWRSEANEVAQAASKWKQRAVTLQQQVSALEASSSQASGEASLLTGRCTALEAEKAKLAEECASLGGQLSACQHELVGCKAQLQDSLTGRAAAARQAESTGHEAAQRAAAVDRLSARLAEETAKTSALRQDLAAVTQQQVRELDAKSRMLSDLTAALAKEERARDAAVRETTSLRSHLATLERELRNAQVALSSINSDRVRSRSAYESAEAALTSAQRQALQYKHENKELPDQRNTWFGDTMQHQHHQNADRANDHRHYAAREDDHYHQPLQDPDQQQRQHQHQHVLPTGSAQPQRPSSAPLMTEQLPPPAGPSSASFTGRVIAYDSHVSHDQTLSSGRGLDHLLEEAARESVCCSTAPNPATHQPWSGQWQGTQQVHSYDSPASASCFPEQRVVPDDGFKSGGAQSEPVLQSRAVDASCGAHDSFSFGHRLANGTAATLRQGQEETARPTSVDAAVGLATNPYAFHPPVPTPMATSHLHSLAAQGTRQPASAQPTPVAGTGTARAQPTHGYGGPQPVLTRAQASHGMQFLAPSVNPHTGAHVPAAARHWSAMQPARASVDSEGSTGSSTLRKLQALLSAQDTP